MRKSAVSPHQAIVMEILADAELRRRIMEQFKKMGRPLTRQAIHAWKRHKHGVPADRVRVVARLMGRRLHEFRPDIWKAPGAK
jgi:hypothetical protein